MHPTAISNLDPIVKVLYNKNGKLRSFLTKDDTRHQFTLYWRANGPWTTSRRFLQEELDEISELMGSPIEKIDLEELEKF